MRLVFLSSALIAGLSFAGDRRGPPQEAFAACSGQSEGSACGFTLNGKNLTGQCRKGPQGETAACLPEGGPGGHHHGPPPEAVAACSGKAEGTACSVTFDNKTLNGTCSRGHHGGDTVACKPEGFGGGHHGPPPEASAACSGKTEGTACSFTHHDRTLDGTCRTGPNGESLACAPQKPPTN